MLLCISQKPPSALKVPVLDATAMVVPRYSEEHTPVLEYYPVCLKQRVAITVNMVWFGTAAIEFQDGEIFAVLKIFY